MLDESMDTEVVQECTSDDVHSGGHHGPLLMMCVVVVK